MFDTSKLGEFSFKISAVHKEILTLNGVSPNSANIKIICGQEETYSIMQQWVAPTFAMDTANPIITLSLTDLDILV
jgi:hypothetical protein